MRKSPEIPATTGRYRRLLYVAAVAPFVCAVVTHAMGPTPQASAPSDQPTGIVFDQYLIDLGEVPPLPILEARFRFTNRGNEAVTIKELKPSCGCLNPRVKDKKTVYQPGESGEFAVRVQTTGEEPGQKAYYVDVAYKNPSLRPTQVQFDFVLPKRKVVVRPRALIFYQLGNEATTREITVTDYREQPLKVLGWKCESPYVTAKIGEVNDTTTGMQTMTVDVTVDGEVPAGRQQVVLDLTTDDPKHPKLRIPIWIQGPTDGVRHASGLRETAKP